MRAEIELGPCSVDDRKMVSPDALSSRDAGPKFVVNLDVPSAKVVIVEYTQIQYSQNVIMDFNTLSWPHISVSTLALAHQNLSAVIVGEST